MLQSVLTWFDYMVIGVVLASIIFGTVKGLLREVVSLISLFLSVVLAFKFASPLSQHVPWFESATACYIVAFVSIAIVVLVVGMLIGISLKNTAKKIGLGGLDHGMGALFGLIRGGLMALLATFLVSNTLLAKSAWFDKSYSKPVFHSAVVWLDGFFPKTFSDAKKDQSQSHQKHIKKIAQHVSDFHQSITRG